MISDIENQFQNLKIEVQKFLFKNLLADLLLRPIFYFLGYLNPDYKLLFEQLYSHLY